MHMPQPLRSDKKDIRVKPYQLVGIPTNQPQRAELIGRILVVVAVVVLIVIAGIVVVYRH